MDVSTISIIIAIIGCLVGAAGWLRNARSDAGQQKAAESEIKTKLDFMSNDMKEIKVDVRSFSRDLQEVRTIAISAEAEAKRANNRLDQLIEGE
jgi:outer membrane murein-binding lipoprotein Lpp